MSRVYTAVMAGLGSALGSALAKARVAAGMTQMDAAVFMRGRGWSTSTSSIGRWEAAGSIPFEEAVVLVVFGYGASLDAVVTRAVEIAAEQARRLADIDPSAVESARGRAEQRDVAAPRRARRGDTRRRAP